MNDRSIVASSNETSTINVYICSVCSKSFLSSKSHSRHVAYHFGRHLPADSVSATNFRDHVAQKKFRCFECDKTFFTMFARMKHQRRHLFTACRSDMLWRSWPELRKKRYMARVAFTCHLCAKVFTLRPCFLVHLQRHGFAATERKVIIFTAVYV